MKLQDISVGDVVKLTCPNILHNTRSGQTITGTVIAVFDALHPDGTEGNLEIDISYNYVCWVRYKPSKDGGSLEIIKRNYGKERYAK